MIVAPLERSEMEARHRLAARSSRLARKSPPRQRNVEVILSLGDLEWFHFRGRAYGVPPLPWKAGQAILETHMDALEQIGQLADDPYDKTARALYYKALARLAALLWRNCRPVGKYARLARALGLLRNPFGIATDGEILEHADFFLARRMRFKGQSQPQPASPHQRTSSRTL